jgi:hypothetical protein
VVTDTDDVPVDVADPAVALDKSIVAIDRDPIAPNYITFTISITNVGPSTLDQLELLDEFDPFYLQFQDATPYPTGIDNINGLVTWADLTAPAPNGFNQNLSPGNSFQITAIFRVASYISATTTNVATVTNVIDVFGNQAEDDDDIVYIWLPGDPGIPTPVEMLYFRALGDDPDVRLEWGTGVEIDTVGFYVYRAPVADYGQAGAIGYTPATGSGSSYAFIDRDVPPSQVYWYWLVEYTGDGLGEVYGPVSSGTGLNALPYRMYLPLVQSNQ